MKAVTLTRWPIQVRDWLGSRSLRAMRAESVNLFMMMCLDQWEHGVACADKEEWRAAEGHRYEDFDRAWTQATKHFEPAEAGGLVHPRVAADREKAIGEIQAKVRGAKRTNTARSADAQRTDSARSADADRTLTGSSASASASSSQSHPNPPAGRDRILSLLAGLEPGHDAANLHDRAEQVLTEAGFHVEREALVVDRGDGKRGRVDLRVIDPPCWIELDRVTAREKSLRKLVPQDGLRIVVLREAKRGIERNVLGVDAVIGLGGGGARKRVIDIDPHAIALPPAIDTPDVRAALVAYLDARAEKHGSGWGPALAAVRIAELASWGPQRAVAALRHSAGYQGLFEPRAGSNANGHAPHVLPSIATSAAYQRWTPPEARRA